MIRAILTIGLLFTASCTASPPEGVPKTPALEPCTSLNQPFVASSAPRQSDDPVLRAIFTQGDASQLRDQLESADPDSLRGSTGVSALGAAAGAGNLSAIKLLIDRNASLEVANASGERPLEIAIISGQLAAACLLIQHGAKFSNPSEKPYLLPAAALADDSQAAVGLVALLIAHGFDPSATINGDTALHIATELGNAPLVDHLLRAGAPVSAPNARGQTALDIARLNHDSELTKVLQEASSAPRH